MGASLLPMPPDGPSAVLGFTGHAVVAAAVSPDWFAAHSIDGPGEAFNPPFLGALATHTGRRVNNIDALFLAPPHAGAPPLSLSAVDDQTHPRVRRALRYRDEVTVYTTPGGVLVLGRGLAGRWEVALEVDPGYRGKGLGRTLAGAATHLARDGRPIWAQIAPGNAASMRAFIAAGYLVVGQEALLVTR